MKAMHPKEYVEVPSILSCNHSHYTYLITEEEADDVREDDEVNDNEDASATAEHPSLIELESKLPSPQPKPPSRIPFVHPHTQFGDIDDLEDFRGR